MIYNRKLIEESMKLTIYELEQQMLKFFNDQDIKVVISKYDEYFNLYIYDFSKVLEKKTNLKSLFSKFLKGITPDDTMLKVVKTKQGFQVVLEDDNGSAKLLENMAAKKCCICGKNFAGFGNDPWPVNKDVIARCCNSCNFTHVIPERIKLLAKKTKKTEATQKEKIENDSSNIILDNRYIWLFNVLADDGTDIREGLEHLQDAIEVLIKTGAAYLVAFPYVDPKPDDISVELVFADNPGPVIIYNKEEATVSKAKLSKPSKEKQLKTKN